MSGELHITVAAAATDEYPRQSEGTVCELSDGPLLLAWQEFWKGDKGSLDSDFWPARICGMTSRDGGRTWGERRVLADVDADSNSCFSPSLLRLPDGSILLAYMRYHSVDPIASTGVVLRSDDDGRSFAPVGAAWSYAPFGPANNALKRLSSGRLLWPVSTTGGKVLDGSDTWVNGTVYSDDGGVSWHEGANWVGLPMRGAMEPHVEELSDGRVLMVMRTQLGAVFQSWSDDGGVTWSKPQTTGLRSPESCPELTRIPQTGDLLIMWNNTEYDPGHYSHYGPRTPLTVALSSDDGRTWHHVGDIETDPGWAFSNPGANVTSDGKVVFNYWCSPYHSTGAMRDYPIDLRVAVADLDWLYAE